MANEMAVIDTKDFRNALGQFATGVTVITTKDPEGRLVGVTASSFNSVSLDPPLVLWSLDKSSASLNAFAEHGYFAVHVLAAGQEELSNNFARRGGDKFACVDCLEGIGGVPMLPECAACFQCQLTYQYEGGDHVILVGEVLKYDSFDRRPLIFHSGRYGRAKPCVDTQATLDTVFEVSQDGGFSSDFLGYLVSRAHYALHLPLLNDMVEQGLKEIHYFILSVLCIKNRVSLSRCSELLEHAGLHPTLDDCREMEQLALLSLSDHGETVIQLTETGRSTYIKLLTADVAREEQAMADFTEEELGEFIGYLKRLVKNTGPGGPDLWA